MHMDMIKQITITGLFAARPFSEKTMFKIMCKGCDIYDVLPNFLNQSKNTDCSNETTHAPLHINDFWDVHATHTKCTG